MSKIKMTVKKSDLPKNRNIELHNALVAAGHRVVPDKKKKAAKYAARRHRNDAF